jgi:hypothetical protein
MLGPNILTLKKEYLSAISRDSIAMAGILSTRDTWLLPE